MPQFNEYRIPAKRVSSLCWLGDKLVDWVGGGASYALDGTVTERPVHYGYRFDAAIVSPSGQYAVIYELLGTKGLLLKDGKILRELNRSYYHAEVYEYPITFIRQADGRELLAHCPNDYCRIDIEDIETGDCLTQSATRKPEDFFHSRLACDASGQRLLSAGWVWHPWDVIALYDVQQALTEPTTLDGTGIAPSTGAEICSAVFADNETLVLLTSKETNDGGKADDSDPLWSAGPNAIVYYDVTTQKCLSVSGAEELVGRCMPVDRNSLVGFYESPKLFDSLTGKVTHRWPQLKTGKQASSIIWGDGVPPTFAIDTQKKRFAVAGDEEITVIEIVTE
ncbi:MAG: hypothetical protein HOP19_29090 [Acidobacteria bacterium]|nr:hypothetical protein [Acidobacteriota bacterium]